MKRLLIIIIILASVAICAAIEMTYVDYPKTQVVTIRIEDYTKMSEAFGKLGWWAGPKGLLNSKTLFLSIYHTNLFKIPEQPPLIDCAITVEGTVTPEKDMALGEVGGGKYAKYVHLGSYDKLEESWNAVMAELKDSKTYNIADRPCFEVYLNNPGQVKPEELITEIYIPVESK